MGLQGDGLTSHLKVSQKLDMLGIGAQHAKDPNGLAWKQNRDFERLLARLNGAQGGEDPGTAVGGFARAGEEESMIGEVAMDAVVELDVAEVDGEGETKNEKKKRKKARDAEAEDTLGDRKEKKRRHSKEDGEPVVAVVEETVVITADPAPTTAPTPSAGPPRGYVSILYCPSILCSARIPHIQVSKHRLFVIVYLLNPIVSSINHTAPS
jgi:Pin2-interacting protein X1